MILAGGAWRQALCLPLGEAESGPVEAVAETVSLQGAEGCKRVHSPILLTDV